MSTPTIAPPGEPGESRAAQGPRLAWIALAALACACGGAPPPDLDEAFRRIQVHEAVIANRAQEAAACAEGERCPAAEAMCRAATSICMIAEEVQDADARARCALARMRCPYEAGSP